MTSSTARTVVACALAALALAACRSATPGAPAGAASSPAVAPQGEQAAMAEARADSARYPYTAADVRFMLGMIPHHAQAVVMSRWAPTHGAGASVQTLAARIINAQQDEIRTMQQWLRDRGQLVPVGDAMTMAMMHDSAGHPMLMPGMLTAEQMRQLDAAHGPEFDRLFLTFMIRHHQGAVAMVRDLFDTYGAAQDRATFKLASDINVDQTTEIARMQQMLAAILFDTPAP
jgi:uncharacterized protein (DUF305 family)